MKILFVTEYFYPYIHGGGEISTQELGKSLCTHGEEVSVLTPNYGTISNGNLEGIKIYRYFFGKRLKNFSDQLSPSWYFNPVYVLILFVQIIKMVWTKKIQIIHVQSLFSLPSAVLAGKMLRIPVIVTFRDSQILCNYGFCLVKDQFTQTCNLRDYFFDDFFAYWQDKVKNKNLFIFIAQFIFAITGRVRTKILQFFVNFADTLVVSSFAQQKTFAVNGFKTKVIHNIFSFPAKFPANHLKSKTILYATKMSSGKGLDILLRAFREVLKKNPGLTLLVIGSGDKQYYEKISRILNIEKNVKFLGRKSPEEVIDIRKNVLLEICPSVYPESFGRTALEALANGVPVVASNRGGLTDIIEDGKTGYIVNPAVNELAEAIIKAVKNNQKLRQNIKNEYSVLKYKFSKKPLNDYIKLYKSVLK